MVGSSARRIIRRPLEKAGTVGLAAAVAAAATALLLLAYCAASLRCSAAVISAPKRLWSSGVFIAASASAATAEETPAKARAGAPVEECDLFDGEWVWDADGGYPLYESRDCPFLDAGFRCWENGHPDTSYTKRRWQPSRCDLPRCHCLGNVCHCSPELFH